MILRAKEIDDCSTKVGLHAHVEVVFFTFGLVEKYEGKGGQFLVMAKPYCLHCT